MFDAVLFDLYGTLAFVKEEAHQARTARFAGLCGVTPSDFMEAWRAVARRSALGEFHDTKQRIVVVLSLVGVGEDEQLAQVIAAEEHEFLCSNTTLYEDVRITLETLSPTSPIRASEKRKSLQIKAGIAKVCTTKLRRDGPAPR